MPLQTHAPETDLALPLPHGEHWDPHTIHTHYFGFSVPEAELGAFLYVRYQPAFPLSQGGVCIFRGLQNVTPLDMEFMDYQITMPWPEIGGNVIETANGLRIEFVEPGRSARVSFTSSDGSVSLDILQTAVTPLLARGHVMPGEEQHHDASRSAGGSEQFMHCTGEIVLRGERHEVDCFAPRDRSWRQVRAEPQGGAAPVPPVAWTPMCFEGELVFNQISIEAPDSDPAWQGLYEIPTGRPTHHFAWLYHEGELRPITRVRRNVLDYHPQMFAALRQEIEAEDDHGRTYLFTGEAIAMAAIPAWPNAGFHDAVYRWHDEQGRVTHCTCQEIWSDKYQRAMNMRARNHARV